MDVAIERVYEAEEPGDGYRVLVDRLWPRGLSKERVDYDLWAKDAAPRPALRKAWHADPDGHSPDGFAAFSADYRAELAEQPGLDALDELVALAKEHKKLTLLYAAKDPEINHAVVLREAILDRAANTTKK